MVIDFHTHAFPDKIAEKTIAILADRSGTAASTDGTVDGLIGSMKDAGVDISVVLPVVTKPSQFESINAFAERINSLPGIISFGGIHPDCEDSEKKIDALADAGFRGIKLHPDYQSVFIDDERYIRIIKRAVERGMIVSIHAGLDAGLPEPIHCPPEKSARMLDLVYSGTDCRDALIVLAHSGGCMMTEDVKKYLAGRNVWFDLAYTVGEYSAEETCEVIRAHGADRILFATDLPWNSQKADIEKLRSLDISEADKEKILWKNASRLLGLSRGELDAKSLFFPSLS